VFIAVRNLNGYVNAKLVLRNANYYGLLNVGKEFYREVAKGKHDEKLLDVFGVW